MPMDGAAFQNPPLSPLFNLQAMLAIDPLYLEPRRSAWPASQLPKTADLLRITDEARARAEMRGRALALRGTGSGNFTTTADLAACGRLAQRGAIFARCGGS